MKLRQFVAALFENDSIGLDAEVTVSLDCTDKNYKKGSDMTPTVKEIFSDGPTIWLRTWKRKPSDRGKG